MGSCSFRVQAAVEGELHEELDEAVNELLALVVAVDVLARPDQNRSVLLERLVELRVGLPPERGSVMINSCVMTTLVMCVNVLEAQRLQVLRFLCLKLCVIRGDLLQ